VVRHRPEHGREIVAMRWGLRPFWAQRAAGTADRKPPLINARAETVRSRPAFRAAFAARRCLMPADGFYEWASGAGGKQPWVFQRQDGAPFAFAALWERGEEGEAPPSDSVTLITTEANATVAPVHDRMPVILPPEVYELWLDPETAPDDAAALLRPLPEDWLEAWLVSRAVNSTRREGPELLRQADLPQPGMDAPRLI
jgi:putative SOS response-associated peptidase YedK